MKISNYIIMASAALMLASCLDTEPLGDAVTAEQKEQTVKDNPARAEAGVTGIMSNFSVYGAVRETSNHNDIGYPAIMLLLDARGTDVVAKNIGYNWYRNALTYEDIDYTYADTRLIWQTLYNQINSANLVTASISGDPTDPTLQGYLAQALAVRAFDYFQLVQCYQKTYASVDPNTALGVPLVTEANKDEAAANGCARSTLTQCYAQILSDLNRAVTLLETSGYKRADKRYIDLATARGLRARVELVMQNYAAALEDAEWVIANSGATPLSIAEASKPGFDDIEANNWLWGILISETDRVVTTGICNYPSHMGSFGYGYASVGAWRTVNKKLYASINATDARKGWFLDADKKSANLTAAQQAYVVKKKMSAYTQVKFAPYNGVLGTSTNACDVPLMRIEEMYLIKAECQAHSDAAVGAQTLQAFVQTYRDASYTFTAANTADVVDEVLRQRRIEFYGEGITWFDLMRLGKNFDRRGAGYESAYVYNIPAGDAALVWRIPLNEIQYNAQISEEQNNPVATLPKAVADE